MKTDYRSEIELANELFEQKHYRDCIRPLIEALAELEEQEHWLLCSVVLAQLGKCCLATGDYVQANLAFRRAKSMLVKLSDGRYTQAEVDVLDGFISQSTDDEMSDDELERLRYRCAKLCVEHQFTEAEDLADREMEPAVQHRGARHWAVAGIKMVQAMCKLGRMKGGPNPDDRPSVDEQMGLMEECRQLYVEVIEIVEENGLRACWLADKARDLAEALVLPEEDNYSADSTGDWTPELDNESEDEARPARRQKAFSLRSWMEPFLNFNMDGTKQELVTQYLAPIDDLFVRHEYSQCFPLLDEVMDRARARNDVALAGLSVVLAARCHRGLGSYTSAVQLIRAGQTWFSQLPQVGERMVQQLDEMAADCENDALIAQQLEAISLSVNELLGNGQFADAADLCSLQLRRKSAALGSDHWLCAALITLRADCLLGQVQLARVTADVSVDQAALLDEARESLDTAAKAIEIQGHDAYWVKGTFGSQVRDRLNELD